MRGKSFGTVASPVVALGRATAGGTLKLIGSETISAAGAFTRSPPSGASILVARAYGGGGSGGCKNIAGNANEYGGQGGDYASGSALLLAGASVTGTVGAGAAGVTSATSTNGNTGGTTNVSVAGTQIVAAAGGPGGTQDGAPVLNLTANASFDLTSNPLPSLGRPAVATQGAGQPAAGPEGGAGGATVGSNVPGNPGVAPGGGGSQASNVQNTTTASGSGASGAVYLSWYGAS